MRPCPGTLAVPRPFPLGLAVHTQTGLVGVSGTGTRIGGLKVAAVETPSIRDGKVVRVDSEVGGMVAGLDVPCAGQAVARAGPVPVFDITRSPPRLAVVDIPLRRAAVAGRRRADGTKPPRRPRQRRPPDARVRPVHVKAVSRPCPRQVFRFLGPASDVAPAGLACRPACAVWEGGRFCRASVPVGRVSIGLVVVPGRLAPDGGNPLIALRLCVAALVVEELPRAVAVVPPRLPRDAPPAAEAGRRLSPRRPLAPRLAPRLRLLLRAAADGSRVRVDTGDSP